MTANSKRGRDTAERNLAVLKDALKKMNVLDRFEFFEVSRDVLETSTRKLESSTRTISALPNVK